MKHDKTSSGEEPQKLDLAALLCDHMGVQTVDAYKRRGRSDTEEREGCSGTQTLRAPPDTHTQMQEVTHAVQLPAIDTSQNVEVDVTVLLSVRSSARRLSTKLFASQFMRCQ
ncbi:unnamed protein product, partial [Brenthis ino]